MNVEATAAIAAVLEGRHGLGAVWDGMEERQRHQYEVWCAEVPERVQARARLVADALEEVVSAPWSRLGPATLTDLAERYGPPAFAGARGEMRRAIREDRALGAYDDRALGGGTLSFIRLSRGDRDRALVSWWYPAPCRLDDSTMVRLAMNPWESVGELLAWLQR